MGRLNQPFRLAFGKLVVVNIHCTGRVVFSADRKMLKGRFLSYLRKEFSSRITIYHNPQCGTSRNTLGLIRNSGIEPEVVEYLKYPLGRTKILEILEQMKLPIRHIVRKNTKPYEDLNLANESVSDSDILDAMVAHPILMNRPIVITERGIKLCRPSHSVLDILPISQQKPYILENCDIIGKDLRFRPKIVRAGSQKYAMIKVDQVDGIAIVTINRPNQRNAVDNTTAGELMDAFSSLDKDASVSAIVLTGAGQTFCAGYDLKSLAESSTHSSTSESNAPLGPFESSGHMGPTRYSMSKPVIAAVEGHAVAGPSDHQHLSFHHVCRWSRTRSMG
jgi:arsenate reductase (glutaredoxin)